MTFHSGAGQALTLGGEDQVDDRVGFDQLVVDVVQARVDPGADDVELADSITVGDETLVLNGMGLRKKAFIKFYL